MLGDWNRAIRDPLDVLRLNFLVGAIFWAATGDVGQGLRFLLAFGIAVLAGLGNLPRPFDLGFLIALAISIWGGPLGLFTAIGWYDVLLRAMMNVFGLRRCGA